MCHDIDDGCLVYHSLSPSTGEGTMKKASLNSFANHAPKPEWVQGFFDLGNDYWDSDKNTLNKKLQVPMFKKFLRGCGLIDDKGNTTLLFDIVSSSNYGWQNGTTWGLALSNFAYNAQCKWFIMNMDIGIYYNRSHISDMLIAEGVKKDDATSIINAFKRFCKSNRCAERSALLKILALYCMRYINSPRSAIWIKSFVFPISTMNMWSETASVRYVFSGFMMKKR